MNDIITNTVMPDLVRKMADAFRGITVVTPRRSGMLGFGTHLHGVIDEFNRVIDHNPGNYSIDVRPPEFDDETKSRGKRNDGKFKRRKQDEPFYVRAGRGARGTNSRPLRPGR